MYKMISLNFLLLLISACGPIPDLRTTLEPDLNPPVFQSLIVQDQQTVRIQFDEPVIVLEEELILNPTLPLQDIVIEENRVTLLTDSQSPGICYTLAMTISDARENSTNLTTDFYGYNDFIPNMLINEFITKGSSSHPDLLELKVLTSGNCGGVTVYQGTPNSYTDRFIFPPFEVQSGDFILVHFKPQLIPEEIDELTDKTISGGLDASDYAFDFWIPEGSGISGNNGVLSLYTCPNGNIIDGVLYSNRSSAADENYLGFGTSRCMNRALELVAAGGWIASGETICPEDAINPEDSTSTRSLCRDTGYQDTNTKADWHIVPTRMSSFGTENSGEIFIR